MLTIVHVGHSLVTRLSLWVVVLKHINDLALVNLDRSGDTNTNLLRKLRHMLCDVPLIVVQGIQDLKMLMLESSHQCQCPYLSVSVSEGGWWSIK